MISLQRASRTGKLEAKNGAFESSFASGLDLSEFGLPSKRQESAAAELLRVKMEESRQASQEEREERWIQEVAKAKGKELQSVDSEEYGSRRHAAPQSTHRPTDLMDNTNIGATLVHMHGEDVNGGHYKAESNTKGKRSLKKTLRQKRAYIGEKEVKKAVVKKSRRSKY